MPLEFLGVIGLAVSVITTSIRYADKLANVPNEQRVFKLLVDTIDIKRKEVMAKRKALDLELSDEKKQNIDKLVAETDRLVSAVRQLLGKPVYESKQGVIGGVIWVLTDRDRVMTYETLLGILHSTLGVIHEELRGLHHNDRPPRYEEIYSADTRGQLLAGLKRWAEAGAKSGDEILPKELGATVGREFEGYTARAKRAMIEEIKRRDGVRKGASKATLKGPGGIIEEVKRRDGERKGPEEATLKGRGRMSERTHARMLREVCKKGERRQW